MSISYYGCKCVKCGWIGSSETAGGGEPLADTGDFDDVYCPKCGGELDDSTEAELCDRITELEKQLKKYGGSG